MRCALVVVLLVVALPGCALVVGPCSVEADSISGRRAAACEPGGSMILIPADVLVPAAFVRGTSI